MLKQEIRRVFLSPYFYLSVLIFTLCNYMGSPEDLGILLKEPENLDLVYMFEAANFGYLIALAPLLAGLATADSYLVETRDGYHYAVQSRSTRRRYCLTKVGVAAGCGILTVLIAHLLYLAGISVLIMVQSGEVDIRKFLGSESDSWGEFSILIARRQYGLYIGRNILYDCLYAAIFPGIALCVSLVTKNRYVVLLSGFLYFHLSGILIPDGLMMLDPGVLSSHGMALMLPHEGLYFRLAMTALYLLAEALIFTIGVERKTR